MKHRSYQSLSLIFAAIAAMHFTPLLRAQNLLQPPVVTLDGSRGGLAAIDERAHAEFVNSLGYKTGPGTLVNSDLRYSKSVPFSDLSAESEFAGAGLQSSRAANLVDAPGRTGVPELLSLNFAPAPPMARGIVTHLPVSLLPQAMSPNTSRSSTPKTSSHGYWTRKRLVIMGISLAVTGGGVAMMQRGGNVPNPNYNLNNCQVYETSVGGQNILVGNDACNETHWSGEKKAGFITALLGGSAFGLSFIPGI